MNLDGKDSHQNTGKQNSRTQQKDLCHDQVSSLQGCKAGSTCINL
jgi:hypothetical protein